MNILKKNERILISENFYLDEFIHPDIYFKFGRNSVVYLNKELVKMVELIRKGFNEARKLKDPQAKEVGLYLNNWATGGNLKNCGLRYMYNPHKKGSHSRHYYSFCADLHCTGGVDEAELYAHLVEYQDFYYTKGLTTIERYEYTQGWVHISIEWRPFEEKIRFIKP